MEEEVLEVASDGQGSLIRGRGGVGNNINIEGEVSEVILSPETQIVSKDGENEEEIESGRHESHLLSKLKTSALRYPMELITFLDSKMRYIEEKIDMFLDIRDTAHAMYLDRISSFLLMTLFRPTLRMIELSVERGRNITSPYIHLASESSKRHLTMALETSLKTLGHSDPPRVTGLLSNHMMKFAYWLRNSDNYPLLLFLFFCNFVLVYFLFFRDGIFSPGRTFKVSSYGFKSSKYSSKKASEHVKAVAKSETPVQSQRKSLTIQVPENATSRSSSSSFNSDKTDDDAASRSSASVATGSPPIGFSEGDMEASPSSSYSSKSSKRGSTGGSGSRKENSRKHFFKGWDFCLLDEEKRAAKKFEDPEGLVGWRVRIRPEWTDQKVTGVVLETRKNLRRKSVFRILVDDQPDAVDASRSSPRGAVKEPNVKTFDLRRVGRNHGVPFTTVAYVGKITKSTTEVLGAGRGKGDRTTSYTIDQDAHALI
jgi:hypothetical protein